MRPFIAAVLVVAVACQSEARKLEQPVNPSPVVQQAPTPAPAPAPAAFKRVPSEDRIQRIIDLQHAIELARLDSASTPQRFWHMLETHPNLSNDEVAQTARGAGVVRAR